MNGRDDTNRQIPSLNVSFIIPALNEADMLPRLLNSIAGLNQTAQACVYEIIVVDAASTDGTAELAKAKGCIVVNTKPGQVATSRNMGAAQAMGNILAYIDADCELPPNWLATIALELQHAEIVAVGSRMAANPTGSTWVERAWFELAHQQHAMGRVSDVKWLATFNLAVKKKSFDQAGGFDESLTTCEDVEFGYRLSTLGTLRRLDSCGVIHHGESKTVKEFYRREAWRARGSLRILVKQWSNPRELFSFILPVAVVGGLIASLILALTSLVLLYQGTSNIVPIASTALAIGPLPIILLTLHRRVKWSTFLPCGLLMCVYFYARFQGTLRPFRRVERTND